MVVVLLPWLKSVESEGLTLPQGAPLGLPAAVPTAARPPRRKARRGNRRFPRLKAGGRVVGGAAVVLGVGEGVAAVG